MANGKVCTCSTIHSCWGTGALILQRGGCGGGGRGGAGGRVGDQSAQGDRERRRRKRAPRGWLGLQTLLELVLVDALLMHGHLALLVEPSPAAIAGKFLGSSRVDAHVVPSKVVLARKLLFADIAAEAARAGAVLRGVVLDECVLAGETFRALPCGAVEAGSLDAAAWRLDSGSGTSDAREQFCLGHRCMRYYWRRRRQRQRCCGTQTVRGCC
jgi:hypothetical protein